MLQGLIYVNHGYITTAVKPHRAPTACKLHRTYGAPDIIEFDMLLDDEPFTDLRNYEPRLGQRA